MTEAGHNPRLLVETEPSWFCMGAYDVLAENVRLARLRFECWLAAPNTRSWIRECQRPARPLAGPLDLAGAGRPSGGRDVVSLP